jgi:hypothetical protein
VWVVRSVLAACRHHGKTIQPGHPGAEGLLR